MMYTSDYTNYHPRLSPLATKSPCHYKQRIVGPDNRCQLILLKFPQPLGILMFMAHILCFLSSLLTSTFRSRLSLQLEIAALRHQLSTFRLHGQRPRIEPADRLLWSVIARLWSQYRRALFFVQPRTITLWQQKRFREYWRALSQSSQPGRPQIAPELQKLIKRMWQANPTWGSPRIVAELQKLGIEVAKSTVEKYRPHAGRPPSSSWRTFLDQHASVLSHIDWRFQQGEKWPYARRTCAGVAHPTSSECNAADGHLSPCPQGAPQARHCGVAVLDKGGAIACGLRLAVTRLRGSENVNLYETVH